MLTKEGIALLERVKAHILEEPRRLDMDIFVRSAATEEICPTAYWPECGTTGCIAGWTVMLVKGREETIQLDLTGGRVGRAAQKLLGISDVERAELFYLWPEEYGVAKRNGDHAEAARIIAARIDQFIAERRPPVGTATPEVREG